MMELLTVEDKKIKLGNVNKVIFDDADISKGAVIEYYQNIAEYMLPNLRNRPLMLQRFPNGISKKGFYQKEISDYFPSWMDSVTVAKREGGSITHIVCNDTPSIVYLANQACLTFHVWQSTKEDPEKPDRIVIDLDPSGDDSNLLKKSLKKAHSYLEEMGIISFPMTTGSRGYHITIPIYQQKNFEEIKNLADEMAADLAKRNPDVFTTAARKSKRGKLIYIDMQRNSYAQTSVAPFSIRAKQGAPVAAPLDWEEATSAKVTSQQFNIKTIFKRMAQKENPWKRFFDEEVCSANLKALEARANPND